MQRQNNQVMLNLGTGVTGEARNAAAQETERSPNHRKANYDLDRLTEENSKNPSLNSTLGCLKVVDTFRAVDGIDCRA